MKTTFQVIAAVIGGSILLLLLMIGATVMYQWLTGRQLLPTTKDDMDNVVSLIQTFGFLAAGAFFAYKLFTGWLIINLSLSLQVTRQRQTNNTDWLLLTLTLEKGATDTLWLTYAACQVRPLDSSGNPQQPISLPVHFFATHIYAVENKAIQWGNTNGFPDKNLTLSPGEKTSFATALSVASEHAYQLEVVVLGNRPFWRKRGMQWRITSVSLPTNNQVANTEKRFSLLNCIFPKLSK